MRSRTLFREYHKSESQSQKRRISRQLADRFVLKLESIGKNWSAANLGHLLGFAHGIRDNPGYLDQLSESEEIALLLQSKSRIALATIPDNRGVEIYTESGERCRGIAGEEKFLVHNPLAERRCDQVWANWMEDREYIIEKHLGKATTHASVWNNDIDRYELLRDAIERGKGKVKAGDRIDFVLDAQAEVGSLKRNREGTNFLHFVVVRRPLHNKKRISVFHGYPITQTEFLNF